MAPTKVLLVLLVVVVALLDTSAARGRRRRVRIPANADRSIRRDVFAGMGQGEHVCGFFAVGCVLRVRASVAPKS